jgi:hypothetical protein
MRTTLILDGDSIAYRCAAAVEERGILVKHKPSGKSMEFKTRTEFKEHMSNRNKTITEDYEIEDTQDPGSVSIVLRTMKQHIEKVANACNADEVIIYAGERDNFRNTLPLPSKYKGNRTGLIRPLNLDAAKAYLRNSLGAKLAIGYEVDDACCIAAYEAKAKGKKAVMYWYEKDQNSFDGIYLLKQEGDEFHETLVPSLGSLWKDKSTIKGLGFRFLAFQLLAGDSIDGLKPTEILKNVRYGVISAYKDFCELPDNATIANVVVEKYQKWFPGEVCYTSWDGRNIVTDWQGMLDMYFKGVYMLRSNGDKTTWKDYFKQRGWCER